MNAVFWDVTSCSSCRNRRVEGPKRLHYQGNLAFLRSVCWLLVTANVVPSSPILLSLMMEALSSSETTVPTRATQCNIPEDDILHSHCRENLKSYIALTGWTL
jgi:hypothetical protein